MARKNRETESPARRRRKKAENPSPKKPKKKKNSKMGAIVGVLAAVALSFFVLFEDDGKVSSDEALPSIIGVLDQIYMGCTVFWYQKGSQYPCTQKIADTLHDSKNGDIKVTVINGKQSKYSATAKHIDGRMVLRVDLDGKIYIKAKDCETNIDIIDVSDVDLEDLEAQCISK